MATLAFEPWILAEGHVDERRPLRAPRLAVGSVLRVPLTELLEGQLEHLRGLQTRRHDQAYIGLANVQSESLWVPMCAHVRGAIVPQQARHLMAPWATDASRQPKRRRERCVKGMSRRGQSEDDGQIREYKGSLGQSRALVRACAKLCGHVVKGVLMRILLP